MGEGLHDSRGGVFPLLLRQCICDNIFERFRKFSQFCIIKQTILKRNKFCTVGASFAPTAK